MEPRPGPTRAAATQCSAGTVPLTYEKPSPWPPERRHDRHNPPRRETETAHPGAAWGLILADMKSSLPVVSLDLGARLGLPICVPGILLPSVGIPRLVLLHRTAHVRQEFGIDAVESLAVVPLHHASA